MTISMRPLAAGLAGVLLAVLAAGCGGEQALQPERSLRLALQPDGLPGGASAEYRIFVQDTVPIAHGELANSETDTVRISSSTQVKVRWQDATATVEDVGYIFSPAEREAVVEEGDGDTTVAVPASYALASGGFALSTPGFPLEATASWWAYSAVDSLLATGSIHAGDAIRRGDLPPGSARLQLDTAFAELDGVRHAYTPPQHDIPLSVIASLDLVAIDAPYALTSVVVRMRPSGLPAGTGAPWGITTISGSYSVGALTTTGTVQTVDLIPPGSYTVDWGEVTVDGVTYLPDPASRPVTLEPRIEPYEFEAVYAAAP